MKRWRGQDEEEAGSNIVLFILQSSVVSSVMKGISILDKCLSVCWCTVDYFLKPFSL